MPFIGIFPEAHPVFVLRDDAGLAQLKWVARFDTSPPKDSVDRLDRCAFTATGSQAIDGDPKGQAGWV
jgi:hypothetical protein